MVLEQERDTQLRPVRPIVAEPLEGVLDVAHGDAEVQHRVVGLQRQRAEVVVKRILHHAAGDQEVAIERQHCGIQLHNLLRVAIGTWLVPTHPLLGC